MLDHTTPDVDVQFRGDPIDLGEYEGFAVYPMPVFTRLSASSPVDTARWYVDTLGFGVMYVGPAIDGAPALVHLRRRKFQDLLIVPGTPTPVGVHFDASGELDALVARAVARGHGVDVETRPYGGREFTISDPDGHEIVFFAAPDQPLGDIDEVMANAIDDAPAP